MWQCLFPIIMMTLQILEDRGMIYHALDLYIFFAIFTSFVLIWRKLFQHFLGEIAPPASTPEHPPTREPFGRVYKI